MMDILIGTNSCRLKSFGERNNQKLNLIILGFQIQRIVLYAFQLMMSCK
jgi:hypothetical protein